jgi:UDP-2,3-diacylglucosamine hydrolase
MRVFYVSDLHLSGGQSPAADRFVKFMQLPQPNDVVVLGGDIFDLYVGDKRVFREKFAPALAAIRASALRGVEVHFLEGNHDFHLQGSFAGLPNFHFHTDDFSLNPGERRFYFSHGDLIDPEDKGYRLLRAITKNRLFRLFVFLVPNFFVDKIGNWSSHQSRKYNQAERMGQEQQKRIRGLYLEFAKQKVRAGAGSVLIGHSHLPDQVAIAEGGRGGEYINLGFSSEYLPYAEWQAGESRFTIKRYP